MMMRVPNDNVTIKERPSTDCKHIPKNILDDITF